MTFKQQAMLIADSSTKERDIPALHLYAAFVPCGELFL
jgi:hypothetical protein